MKAKPRRPRVAIAQVEPVYLDAKASLSKTLQMIQQAKQQNAELVAFGETWLLGAECQGPAVGDLHPPRC